MIIDQLTAIPSPQGTDELPIERGTLTYKITYDDLVGDAIGDVSTLSGFTATDLTGAANELKTDVTGVSQNVATLVRPNLLDNWYFVGGGSQQGGGQFPINQRGQTNYIGRAMTIDRFLVESAGTATVYPGYVEFTDTAIQFISLAQLKDLKGKTVTLSALQYYNGQNYLKSATGVVNEYTTDTEVYVSLEGGASVSFHIFANAQSYQGCRIFGGTNGVHLLAVKLEIGDTQTLAHQENGVWVLNEIPNYQQELAKCQRYFIGFNDSNNYHWVAFGTMATTTDAIVVMPTPVSMRTTPTVEFNDVNVQGDTTIWIPVTGINIQSVNVNGVALLCTINGTYTAGSAVSLAAKKIYLSADL